MNEARTKLSSLVGYRITEVKIKHHTIEIWGRKSRAKIDRRIAIVNNISQIFDCDGNWFEES